MEYRILGPLQVVDGDREVPLGSPKERALLALLLLHANAVVSRERLIDQLWGESPPPTAAKALHVHVSQLRKTLMGNGRDPIATRPPGYRLELGDDRLDAARFEELVEEARRRVVAGEMEAADELLRDALALWRGRALDGIELEAVRNEVERLEELRILAQMDRVDCELALGMDDKLIGELEMLVKEHPLRERLYGQLILALYRSGRQADALRCYRRARDALVEELGLEPSPALQRLEKAILNHDPALETPTGRAGPNGTAPGQGGAVARSARTLHRSRRAVLTIVGAAVVVAAAAVVVAVTRGTERRLSPVPNSLVSVGADGRLETLTRVGMLPDGIAYASGSVWVLNRQDGTLSMVDARSGVVQRTLSMPGVSRAVTAGAGAVWVAGVAQGSGVATKIDARNGEVQATTWLRHAQPIAIAAGEGAVWVAVTSVRGDGVVRISPRTGAAGPLIPLPKQPVAIVLANNAVWVVGLPSRSQTRATTTGALYVLDSSSGRMSARLPVAIAGLRRASLMTAADGAIWVASGSRFVSRIDATTARLTERVPIAGRAIAVAGTEGMVWVLDEAATAFRIDPVSRRSISSTELVREGRAPPRPAAAIGGGGRLWVTLAPRTIGIITPATARIGSSHALTVALHHEGPARIQFLAGALWIKNSDTTASRIDPRARRVTATFVVGGAWGDFTYGAGSVWATSSTANTVTRIDPATNKVVARMPSGGSGPQGIAYARGAVWVANIQAGASGRGSVARIDPRSNRVVATMLLGKRMSCCGPDNMVAAAGDVWVDIPDEKSIVRIDTRRNRVAARIRIDKGCGELASGAGSVWVAEGCSNEIIRIDPRTNTIVARIKVGTASVYPITFANGSLWATTDDLRLVQIDPRTNSILDATNIAPAVRPGGGGPYFAYAAGAFWFTDTSGKRVLRLERTP